MHIILIMNKEFEKKLKIISTFFRQTRKTPFLCPKKWDNVVRIGGMSVLFSAIAISSLLYSCGNHKTILALHFTPVRNQVGTVSN